MEFQNGTTAHLGASTMSAATVEAGKPERAPREKKPVAPMSKWPIGALLGVVAIITVDLIVSVRTTMMPWVLSRGLGLGAAASLAALSLVGLWRRHPVRATLPVLKPATLAKVHTGLASATMVLLAGHVAATVADSYAHVGIVGALVPMESPYKPWPVTLGTLSMWLLLAIWATARLSTSITKKSWKAVHRASMFTFGCVWLHGMTVGTDARALRPVYWAVGGIVLGVWLSGVALQVQAVAKKRSAKTSS